MYMPWIKLWTSSAAMALEANEVIARRLFMLGTDPHSKRSATEAWRMTSEKALAGAQVWTGLAGDAMSMWTWWMPNRLPLARANREAARSASRSVSMLRKKVRANQSRLRRAG
ncbi:MAG: hypothetical protein EPO01_10160 [Aquabacterium sp.]|nr:MAG: hypothetical protein EPO01_10160 [Aquabacterium sp.]